MMRCQALDDDGKKCRQKANRFPYSYFGNDEMNQGCDWVRVYLCQKHCRGQKMYIKITKKEKLNTASQTKR